MLNVSVQDSVSYCDKQAIGRKRRRVIRKKSDFGGNFPFVFLRYLSSRLFQFTPITDFEGSKAQWLLNWILNVVYRTCLHKLTNTKNSRSKLEERLGSVNLKIFHLTGTKSVFISKKHR